MDSEFFKKQKNMGVKTIIQNKKKLCNRGFYILPFSSSPTQCIECSEGGKTIKRKSAIYFKECLHKSYDHVHCINLCYFPVQNNS